MGETRIVETVDQETRVPHLAEKAPVVDVDVHEELRSVRELIQYLGEPWRSRIEIADGWKGVNRFLYSYPRISGMAEAATTDGAPAGSSYELMREQLLDAYGVELAVLVRLFTVYI